MRTIILFTTTVIVLFAASLLIYRKTIAPDKNVVVTTPAANAAIASPLQFSGKARGVWFFEAIFPVEVRDADGNVLGAGVAQAQQAQGEWMTMDFIPFAGTVQFTAPSTKRGSVAFKKDNPSGLPENDAEVVVPVIF